MKPVNHIPAVFRSRRAGAVADVMLAAFPTVLPAVIGMRALAARYVKRRVMS